MLPIVIHLFIWLQKRQLQTFGASLLASIFAQILIQIICVCKTREGISFLIVN